jgi:pterin-4a-carbinolamine dehydratase
VIVPIIGRSWEGKLNNGTRRIEEPTDWVHREIKFALEKRRESIVPILIDGVPALAAAQLPVPLQPLVEIQALKVNVDNWNSDIEALVQLLKEKYSFQPKSSKYRFPKPNPAIAKTIPYPWNDLTAEVLGQLSRWRIEFSDDPEKLHYKRVELTRDFDFKSFDQAMEFVNVAAKYATEADHHPRWMNVWRTVTVWLSTWDAGHRVTVLDVNFARFLERTYKKFDIAL